MRNVGNVLVLLFCWGASWYWAVTLGGRSAWLCFYGVGIMFIFMGVGLLGMSRSVRVELLEAQTRLWSGEPQELKCKLSLGRWWLPSGWLLLDMQWHHVSSGDVLVLREVVRPSLSGSIVPTFRLPRLARGLYRLVAVNVSVSDAFGLLRISRRAVTAAHELLVVPQPLALQTARPEGVGEALPRRGSRLQLQRQAASPFAYGTRPYTPGDPLNRIHWRSTARTGALRAKESEQPQADRLLVCLDAAGGRSNAVAFESAVQAAAGLAMRALQHGLGVRLAANDRQGQALEARGRERLPQLLELLALLPCDGDRPLAAHVQREAQHMGPGAGVAVVTAQPDEQLLRLLCRLRPRAVHLVYIHGEGAQPDAVQVWRRQAEAAGCRFTAVSAGGRRTAEGGEGDGEAANLSSAGA